MVGSSVRVKLRRGCEVCCNPIEITYAVEDDTLSSFAPRFWNKLWKFRNRKSYLFNGCGEVVYLSFERSEESLFDLSHEKKEIWVVP